MNKQQYAQMMERRQFLKLASMGALGAVAMAACSTGDPALDDAAQDETLPDLEWDIATSWPAILPTIFGGAETIADRVAKMTGGKFMITAQPAGEVVPALEILQNIETNTIDSGHTAGYYYIGLDSVTAYSTALPFGLTARQQNAWLYEAGGLEMLQEIYAERFNAILFPAGNTGVQMGGWFNVEIQSKADLEGLIMRIPGLGGQVFTKLGTTVQVLPGGEIFQALQTGAIDATEWVGPFDDTTMGFGDVAKFYYHPGWWEPGTTVEFQIPLPKWNALPDVYKAIVETACRDANVTMMAAYDALNTESLKAIVADPGITILPFPDDVMEAAAEASQEINDENIAASGYFADVFPHWDSFRKGVQEWHGLAETSYNAFVGKA